MNRLRPAVWQRTWALAVLLGWMVGPAAARQSSQEQTRESWQRVPDIFAALGAQPGAVVADVGAGGGFFTERLAKVVGPSGRVLAVDVDRNALARLQDRMRASGISNVETVEGQPDNPKLPAGSLDGALIVNAYHEMVEHQAMLTRIREALKPSGRLVIVEPISDSTREGTRDTQTRRHEIAARFVQDDARAAGFRIVSFEEPFAERPSHDYEYMLVLAPALGAATRPAPGRSESDPTCEDLRAPELRISGPEFAPLQKEGRAIVLDVREPSAYARGHIPGARLAPMSDLRNLVGELRTSTLPIVAYCDCPAEESSARAVLYLRKRGVTNVHALAGGWEQWIRSGGPVTSGAAVVRFGVFFNVEP